MRQPIVAGNWKMNGTRASASELIDEIIAGMDSVESAEIVVCPPYTLIPQVADALNGCGIAYGAQDVNTNDFGAYTGEVSGPMLQDFGCRYVIVGHSERRAMFGDTNDIVAEKFKAAQRHDLIPILCVGETLTERENDQTEAVIGDQLDAVIDATGVGRFAAAVIAYEPVWAIGTGKTATPDQAQQVHRFIRDRLKHLDHAVAEDLRLLYGGSVKGENAKGLFSQPDIDGGLIGGASLQAEEFLAICRAT